MSAGAAMHDLLTVSGTLAAFCHGKTRLSGSFDDTLISLLRRVAEECPHSSLLHVLVLLGFLPHGIEPALSGSTVFTLCWSSLSVLTLLFAPCSPSRSIMAS